MNAENYMGWELKAAWVVGHGKGEGDKRKFMRCIKYGDKQQWRMNKCGMGSFKNKLPTNGTGYPDIQGL